MAKNHEEHNKGQSGVSSVEIGNLTKKTMAADRLTAMDKRQGKNKRTLRYAIWLGWAAESNWTDPYLFAIYSIIRPLASMMIVIVMFFFVSTASGTQNDGLLAFMFIGSAFYMYMFSLTFDLCWIIHQDREHYKVLKYIYTSPSNLYIYLMGRGLAKVLVTTIAVSITFIFGFFVLKIPFSITLANVPFLLAALLLGFGAMIALGIALASLILILPRHSDYVMESMAGIFYLFCGVLFPLSVMPGPMQAFGQALPFTYWFELLRRCMIAPGGLVNTGMDSFSNLQILGILAVTTLVFIIVSALVYRTAEKKARKLGNFDIQTWF